jgi:peptidoglycan hydrolase-like protein with peptidoglycan-binding domain
MSELGYLNIPIGISHGYYGTMTRDAVGRYQATQSVTPTAGYFGPLTKTAMHQQFALHGWTTLLGW